MSIFVLIFFQFGQSSVFVLFNANATYVNTIGIKGYFTINSDANTTATSSVTLSNELTGVNRMRFWNTPAERDSASWETYSATKSWTLTWSEGGKIVYGEFENPSSNTLYISDEIIYDIAPDLPFTWGLTLWLDASDDTTITQTSGNVSQWNDKSGNGYHAKQNTGANQANILTDEMDFNGSSDYFYLQSLNYTSAAPMDGLLVCTVFKTTNTNTSLSGNWAFLDFDRSEWFNFYSRWDGVGLSYDAGWIQDINVSGVGINDNAWHVACASYDNSLTNDTIITIDGTTQFSSNLEAPGSQIGVWQSTRFGFVGDGSEAPTENGARNNAYYDGWMAEMVYYESAVSSTNRKDVECYLWEKWSVNVSWCPADTQKPIASVSYLPAVTTSSDVTATLENESESITITNNSWSTDYIFTSNGTFTFEFQDSSGNTWSTLAKVDWIDPWAPPAIGTGSLNDAPIITSYSWAATVNLDILSGATDVATIVATDTAFNVIWEYGKATLSGNSWLSVNTYEMCSPSVVVSHRQDVNGEIQRAPRVRNKTSTGFEVHVDNYNSTIGAISTNVDFIVMSSGSYDLWWGLIFEAWSKTTSAVACNANSTPTPQVVNFLSSFTAPPVVLHTISTENDSTWTVSWVNGDDGTRQSEPTISKMGTVLQRSFNSCTHGSEDLDYFAIDPWNYSLIDGTVFDAVRSTDSIASITGWGNPITFGSAFSSVPQTVLVSQLWEDGGNGWYTQIHTGWAQVTTSQVFATIDEDGPGADRNHTNEIASSIAFDKSSGQFWETNTLTYSIIGGTDAADFIIDSVTGDLNFITGKDPLNFTDSDTNGIYEVLIEARDSHCNSLVDTQTILAKVKDETNPTVTSFSPGTGSLLPWGNHTLSFEYNDTHTGSTDIDTTADSILLEKWDSLWSVWNDVTISSLSAGTVWSTGATYPTSNLSFGKYRYTFSIDDRAGNTSNSVQADFYIDIPEFIISTGSIDIGTVNEITETFSDTVTVTVKTVGAGFDVYMNTTSLPLYGGESIPNWDGSIWYGYDLSPFSSSLSTMGANQNIATQTGSINTDGNKNTYTYNLKLWALIQSQQAGGDYSGNIDFGINLDY